MADSVSQQPSWIPLIEQALSNQVAQTGSYVFPDAKCSIIYGPEPAVFDDGQILATTLYHVDACLWRENIFIEGATFLVPSIVPQTCLKSYCVNLDHTTGVHHVTLRKTSLRKTLALNHLSNPDFSSHVVEFSGGRMTAVPRVECAGMSHLRKVQNISHYGQQSHSPPVQLGCVHRQCADGLPSSVTSSGPESHEINSIGKTSNPAGLDSSITGLGRVVGQQAAYAQPSLCTFSKSILHLVPRSVTVSTSIEADSYDPLAQAQEPVVTAVDIQPSDSPSTSRRSSNANFDSGISMSTVPTSPASSTFLTVPFEKSAVANLPKVPIAPGKPTDVFKALALEEAKVNGPENTGGSDETLLHRLAWDLSISDRQLKHWDKIQDGESVCLEEIVSHRSSLAITEDGQVVLPEEASNKVESSLSSPRLTSKMVKDLPTFYTKDVLFSQNLDALDVVRVEFVEKKYSQLFPLDLAFEAKEEQCATVAARSRQFPSVLDQVDTEITLDSASGQLYLRPKTIATASAVQSFSAATSTNTATGSSVPVQDQPLIDSAASPHELDGIDLTAIFNQAATDLDDEDLNTQPPAITYHFIGSRLARTHYMPAEYADYVERMVHAQPFIPRIVVEANEYWNLVKANVESARRAQGCPERSHLRRSFRESDSDLVFRELLNLENKTKAVIDESQDVQFELPTHHYNLVDQPVIQNSQNPSAVSYWAATVSSRKTQIKDGVSWKAVVSSQAAKWVDPCTLSEDVEIPDDLRLRENSTALRNFVTGLTTIQYGPWGTWMSDTYDPDQEIPEVMSVEVRETILNASSASDGFQGLQQPHFMRPEDGSFNVNDDGTAMAYPSQRLKEEKGWENRESCGYSNLRLVDDGTGQTYSVKGMRESRIREVLKNTRLKTS